MPVYDATQVDEYLEELHRHVDELAAELARLQRLGTHSADSSSIGRVLVQAQYEAQSIIDAAHQEADTIVSTAQRAADVMRATAARDGAALLAQATPPSIPIAAQEAAEAPTEEPIQSRLGQPLEAVRPPTVVIRRTSPPPVDEVDRTDSPRPTIRRARVVKSADAVVATTKPPGDDEPVWSADDCDWTPPAATPPSTPPTAPTAPVIEAQAVVVPDSTIDWHGPSPSATPAVLAPPPVGRPIIPLTPSDARGGRGGRWRSNRDRSRR